MKSNKRTLFVILMLCFVFDKLCAQTTRFYTMQQGLNSSYINSLFVDDQNFLWISTGRSLEVFDGSRFQTISFGEAGEETSFKRINNIRQKDSTHYWLMSNLGLSVYDKSNNSMTQVQLSSDTAIAYPINNYMPYPGKDKSIFSSEGYGFFVIDNKSLEVDSLQSSKFNEMIGESYIWDFVIDRNGCLWVSDFRNRVTMVNMKSWKRLRVQTTSEAQEIMSKNHVMNFVEDRNTGDIYMAMSHSGVLVYRRKENIIRELRHNNRSLYSIVIYQSRKGDIFLGTDNMGLMLIDPKNETIESVPIHLDLLDSGQAKVHAFAEDKDGNLIVGVYQKGFLVVPSQDAVFKYNVFSANDNGKNSSCVTSFCCDSENNVWAGTDGSGVFVNGKCVKEGLRSLLVQSIITDNSGNLWCGSWRGGIACSDNKQSFYVPEFLKDYSSLNIMDLVYDSENNIIYAGSNGEGVLKIDLNARSVNKIKGSEIFRWVSQLHLDSRGNLWIGDAMRVFCYSPLTDTYSEVKLKNGNITLVNCFAEDDIYIYFATTSGIYCYDKRQNKAVVPDFIKKLPETLDLRNILICGDNIWLSTNRSIMCIGKSTGKITEYNSFNGHYIGEFHLHSSMIMTDGTLYFGGDNGAVCFKPGDLLNRSKKMKPVFFSPLWIGDKISGSSSYHITFAVPEITNQDRLSYDFILEGYEDKWHTTTSAAPEAYYASLPPGNYTFRVKAYFSDSPEQFTENQLKVCVPYPWYATWWAYLLYTLMAGLVGYIIYKNMREKRLSKALLVEAEHNEHIKEDRLRLFTSIAHELRSPLTMIMSPLRQLTMSDRNLERQGNYSIMQRNCNRISRIVNQMLDVRKIENGQFHLHFTETDLNTYIKEVMESFMGIAAAKAISFRHESSEQEIMTFFDLTHFEKVLFNLLSNAFKFTPAGGSVIVRSASRLNSADPGSAREIDDYRVIEYAEVRIYNSGSHLEDEDIKHLWERFYQGKSQAMHEGSGIGLNLSYELVRLHHGTIQAHNIGEDGVEFIVRIPMGNVHLTEEELSPACNVTGDVSQDLVMQADAINGAVNEIAVSIDDVYPGGDVAAQLNDVETLEGEKAEDDQDETSSEQVSILIVDDDKELCDYMATELQKKYIISTANSGNSAWQIILKKRPTIVVTDLIMADGDGYDLCRRIKANPETDHIAVIVLTSESNEDSRLRSMNLNADHFLPKPFNLPLIQSAISQVLRVRENIRNKMRRTEIGYSYNSIEIDSYEDKLIQRVKELVLKHLDNSEFNVNELSRELGVSRVQLYRKLKEHFGISPNAYIRSVRLKQAAHLLVNNKVNVSEVAYRVGFSSHSYFSSIFHTFFGMSPKEFVATYSDNLNDETLQKMLE